MMEKTDSEEKGVDGTVVSYPGAHGDEVARTAGLRPWGKILRAYLLSTAP